MLLTEALNATGSIAAIAIGALLLSDGLGGGELPFLLFGLLLIIVGVFRIGYRLLKGKWFRFFGR